MECPNCHFHNMPGNTRCLKCGARLDVAAATIVVEPPRASARTKRWRRWLPRLALWLGLSGPARLQDSTGGRPQQPAAQHGAGAGGGHLAADRARLGPVVFGQRGPGAELFCPLAGTGGGGAARLGTLLGSVALYAALCIHGISIAEVPTRPARGRNRRLQVGPWRACGCGGFASFRPRRSFSFRPGSW